MADKIFGNRFFGYREPAWHGKGIVSPNATGAQDAWSRLCPYSFEKRPIYTTINGEQVEVGKAIVRTPVPDDPNEKLIGLGSDVYNIVDPQAICEAYDRVTKRPIETIGALDEGKIFFLTTELPEYDIKGEQIKRYVFVYAPYEPGSAIEVRNTDVRVVCWNTASLARSRASELWKGWHNNKNLEKELEIWLEHAIVQAEQRANTIQQWFGILADYQVEHDKAIELLFKVYPDPKPLPGDFPIKLRGEKQEAIDKAAELSERDRSLALQLFEGAGTGSTTKAAAGTLWGWYNAVTEYEDWGKSAKKDATSSILVGNRANTKAQAFEVAYAEAIVR
jgi:phage/plasmid-like protein (TIGR03299 family)